MTGASHRSTRESTSDRTTPPDTLSTVRACFAGELLASCAVERRRRQSLPPFSATPSNSLLVSNAPDQAYLATGHAALVMPSTVDYLTGHPNHAFQQDLQELADTLRQHGGYVFWKQTLDPVATPEQLATHVHLHFIAAEPSEALYQVLPSSTHVPRPT
jgi:hypothetical protein